MSRSPHAVKIQQMLELQQKMNTKVHPQWRDQHFQFYRAIWTECSELLDHYGWKWWKKQDPDIEQIKLEIVDIWHFGMSVHLQVHEDVAALAQSLAESLQAEQTQTDFRAAVEQLALTTLTTKGFEVDDFAQLMHLTDMSVDELFRQYVGKNVLNFFRQDHGYKEGSYIKEWQGREDNEHLSEILDQLDAEADGFQERVYQALEERYPE